MSCGLDRQRSRPSIAAGGPGREPRADRPPPVGEACGPAGARTPGSRKAKANSGSGGCAGPPWRVKHPIIGEVCGTCSGPKGGGAGSPRRSPRCPCFGDASPAYGRTAACRSRIVDRRDHGQDRGAATACVGTRCSASSRGGRGSIMYVSDLKEPSPAGLRRARRLQSPYGLVSRSVRLPNGEGEPPFSIFTSLLDNPSAVLHTQRNWSHSGVQGNFDGAGGAVDPVRARDISIAESLERYSSCTWNDSDLIMAAEADLGADAVGPRRFPGARSASSPPMMPPWSVTTPGCPSDGSVPGL